VIACIECIFLPFGTILGVSTIIVLSHESTKQLFEPSPIQTCERRVAEIETAKRRSY
jgi:hypothetical protein